MGRITLKSLITADLKYCCEYRFWLAYRKNRFTPLIADRLGVSIRSVQKHKAAFRRGDLVCQQCAKCMLNRPAPQQ